METRKRLYKATNAGLTLTERVKKDRSRQNTTRNDRFNANRNIAFETDTPSTPAKPMPVKMSQIKDRPEKLKAYIEQKRANKLKQHFEQRSPFIPYVPVGRWVERKEPLKKPKAFTLSTPIRKALMSDGKILKKSTIKEIATTATKENFTAVKKSKQTEPAKSRKKILTEFNTILPKADNLAVVVEPISKQDDTFEIICSDDKQEENVQGNESVKEIKSPEKSPRNEEEIAIAETPVKESIIEKKEQVPATPPVEDKKESNKQKINLNKKEVKSVKIVVPVSRPTREKKPAVVLESKKQKLAGSQKESVKSISLQQQVTKSPIAVHNEEKPVQKIAKKVTSSTYTFYKSSLDNQAAYISIQLKAFASDMDNFINKLPEDIQSNVHQTIQQGNLLINEKMKGFEDLLEKFENSPNKNISGDDVDNYWLLLFEQIEKFKENLQCIKEAKIIATKKENKRRTRRTITDTPTRRSRRIAETGETPKHNAATCFGCTPLSASKVNTPKSAKSRRTAFKKSIAFDQP